MDNINSGRFAAENEITFAKSARKIRVPVCDKITVTELSDDFTLPDYRPEIRRLLRITATLPTPSSYTGGATAEFSGDIVYSVLYVGGDGKLNSVDLTAVYEADAELSDKYGSESVSAFDELEAENIVGRVLAPRKLNIRCRLRHHIIAEGERSLETSLEGEVGQESIMKLTDTLPSRVSRRADDDSYEISEIIPLGGEIRVIAAEAVPFINEASVRDGGVFCSGSVFLKLLTDTDESKPSIFERKIPFEAVIPDNLEGDGWDCRAWGCVPEIKTEAAENGISCKMRLSLSSEAQKNEPVKLTRDIYATDRACEISAESLPISVGMACAVGNFTLSGAAELSGLDGNYEVISATANAQADELSSENGRYVLTGKCRFSTLILSGEEYSCREFELPFKYEFGNADSEVGEYSVDLCCPSVRVRGDGNMMTADAEICAAVSVRDEQSVEAVTYAGFGEPFESVRPAYTVVYIPKGENLWSIAKKYSADPSAIATANGLKFSSPAAPDSLNGVDFLII